MKHNIENHKKHSVKVMKTLGQQNTTLKTIKTQCKIDENVENLQKHTVKLRKMMKMKSWGSCGGVLWGVMGALLALFWFSVGVTYFYCFLAPGLGKVLEGTQF